MSEVKRWDLWQEDIDSEAEMVQDEFGDYVLHSDYQQEHEARLAAERAVEVLAVAIDHGLTCDHCPANGEFCGNLSSVGNPLCSSVLKGWAYAQAKEAGK